MYWNPKKTELMCMCVGSIKKDVIANYTFLHHHGKMASTRTFIDPSWGGGELTSWLLCLF